MKGYFPPPPTYFVSSLSFVQHIDCVNSFITFLQMTKTIKKLEKEKVTWKTKCENSNRSLVQMVDEVNLITLKDKTSYFDAFFSLEIDGILS